MILFCAPRHYYIIVDLLYNALSFEIDGESLEIINLVTSKSIDTHARIKKALQWYVYSAQYICSVLTIRNEFKCVPGYSEYITTTNIRVDKCITRSIFTKPS